jgi:hypothetical protein
VGKVGGRNSKNPEAILARNLSHGIGVLSRDILFDRPLVWFLRTKLIFNTVADEALENRQIE